MRVRRRRGVGACSAPATRARPSWPRTPRSACCPASIVRRSRRPSRRARAPAVLLDVGANVECRPSHLRAVRRDGRGVRAASRSASSAPRVGLLSIGEEESKGNELTREAHQLLKTARCSTSSATSKARDVYNGDADVIVCDGFTGNVALKISEGLVDTVERAARARNCRERLRHTRRLAAVAARRSAGFAAASTTPSTAARRCSASTASASSATAARRPRRCATPSRWPAALRPRRWSPHRADARDLGSRRALPEDRCRHDRVRLSRPGIAEGRHGPGAAPTPFPICRDDVRRGRRGARRAAQPAVLRGARDRADADREHAAGDSRHRASRSSACSRSRGMAPRRSSPATASASTRRTSPPARSRSRMRVRTVRRRGRYMQEAVPVGDRRDGGHSRSRCRRRRRGPAPRRHRARSSRRRT